MKNHTRVLFIELVRAGLWEDCDKFHVTYFKIQEPEVWEEIYRLALEQSVLGLILAGLEHSVVKPPQEMLLQWIGEVQMLEQQNNAMNVFIADLVGKMRNADIYSLLVKGQGVAQSYVRPLWRSFGDVDLLLSTDNYEKAKSFLTPLAKHIDPEDKSMKHLGMTIDHWIVELHGTMHTEISQRVNRGIDEVQFDCFYNGNVRSCDICGTIVFLPSPDNDVILIFTHILEHFFVEGVGLRQVCDWCRLLYRYHDKMDLRLLKQRIRRMGLMTEWKAFASLAVDVLGMQEEIMPFYDIHFRKRGQRVLARIMKSGNMGHNNDLSYRAEYSGFEYKMVSLWRRIKDYACFTLIFLIDSPKFFVNYVIRKVKS